MRTYVLVSFILGCMGLFFRLVTLAIKGYPRTTEHERWEDVVQLAIAAGFVVWAWRVLWP